MPPPPPPPASAPAPTRWSRCACVRKRWRRRREEGPHVSTAKASPRGISIGILPETLRNYGSVLHSSEARRLVRGAIGWSWLRRFIQPRKVAPSGGRKINGFVDALSGRVRIILLPLVVSSSYVELILWGPFVIDLLSPSLVGPFNSVNCESRWA